MLDAIVQDCARIQTALLPRIDHTPALAYADLRRIAGVDLAYWERDGRTMAVCCLVIVDAATLAPLECVHHVGPVDFPYLPGYLSFRELPHIIAAFEKATLRPDVVLFDGNGYLHPRHMGIATHAAFELGLPTIGIAKTYLRIDDADFVMPDRAAGSYTDIVIRGEVYGRAVRTRDGVRPLFVSCGNGIDLDSCTRIALACVRPDSRLPVPVRLADLRTHEMRAEMRSAHR